VRPAVKSTNPFRVDVRELPTSRIVEVDAAFVAAAVTGMPLRDTLEHDDPTATASDGGTAELELTEAGEDVFARGHIRGKVTVACSRCVGPAALLIDDELMVTFVPASKMPPDHGPAVIGDKPGAKPDKTDHKAAKAEGKAARAADAKAAQAFKDGDDEVEGVELEENDLDVFPYDGETVDLEPLIREQFVLAVPYAPLCREDCRGLCAQCGADKNVAPCACDKPLDPRFAALQGLKLPS